MPWNVSDVERFNKGLTDSQKQRWVSIANAILKDCKKEGDSGSFDDCEAKAVVLANKMIKKSND